MSLVFIDIDTQKDFMLSNGALSIPNAMEIAPTLKALKEKAIRNNIKIIATSDTHTKDTPELIRNGGPFPDHCMKGSDGWERIDETCCAQYSVKATDRLDNLNCVNHIPMYVFEKDTYDIFDDEYGNYNFEKYLKVRKIETTVVFGVATNICVKAAVIGLLKRNIKTYVVEDAIKGLYIDEANNEEVSIREMKSAGAVFINSNIILC